MLVARLKTLKTPFFITKISRSRGSGYSLMQQMQLAASFEVNFSFQGRGSNNVLNKPQKWLHNGGCLYALICIKDQRSKLKADYI